MTFAVGATKPTVVVLAPLVAVKTLEELPCKVKSLPVLPIVVVALVAPIERAAAAAVSMLLVPTFKPLTAVAVKVPPETLPPLKVPPEMVAPFKVPLQAKLPLLLVTVQPVLPLPPPKRMSPVLIPPMLMVLVPLASTVKPAVALMAVPDTLRLFTALAVKVPPLTVPPETLPPLKVPPVMVAVLIVPVPVVMLPLLVASAPPAVVMLLPLVVRPPGKLTWRPLLPIVMPDAFAVPILMVPVVPVLVPTSTLKLPEAKAPLVTLPVVIASALVAAPAALAVLSAGDCKLVAK